MRKLYRRLPKGLRFGLGLALLALLLTGFWLLQGRPCVSAEAAFRQGLRNAAVTPVAAELMVPNPNPERSWLWNSWCVGTDGRNTYGLGVVERRSDLLSFLHVWKPRQGLTSLPVTEGICYMPIRTWSYKLDEANNGWWYDPSLRGTASEAFQNLEDLVLIKATGDHATLDLVLEDLHDEGELLLRGGVYRLQLGKREGDWYFFRFRGCYLPRNSGDDAWEEYERSKDSLPAWEPDVDAARAYFDWVRFYLGDRLEQGTNQPAHFLVTEYDEGGAVLRQVRIQP